MGSGSFISFMVQFFLLFSAWRCVSADYFLFLPMTGLAACALLFSIWRRSCHKSFERRHYCRFLHSKNFLQSGLQENGKLLLQACLPASGLHKTAAKKIL